jgi:GNAT superfamily N-acetyltransferase
MSRDLIRRLGARLYQRQVKFRIPPEVIERNLRSLPPLPAGYSARSPRPGEDLARWAALLNGEGAGFGAWTPERVQREVVSRLIRPDAATLLFRGDELVGCATTDSTTSWGKRIGLGMFLYVQPRHRAKDLSRTVIYRTLAHFLGGGFDRVVATTDPTRLSALAIYLAEGYLPVYDSLLSPFQWWRARRRLGPAAERLRRMALRRRTAGGA